MKEISGFSHRGNTPKETPTCQSSFECKVTAQFHQVTDTLKHDSSSKNISRRSGLSADFYLYVVGVYISFDATITG